MATVNVYRIRSNESIEWKDNATSLELVGMKAAIETLYGTKGSKAYRNSTYTSEPATLDLMYSIGSTFQLTIQDNEGNYHIVRMFKVSVNGILFAISNDDEVLKLEIEPLTI